VTLTLRTRLTLALVAVLGLSLTAFSLVLDAAFRRALWAQFDARLVEDASAAVTMVEVHQDGSLELETASLPGFEPGREPSYFEIWTEGGSVFARSPSLAERHLSRPPNDGLMDATLPDGHPGRFIQARLAGRRDPEASSGPDVRVVVVVARHTDEVAAAVAKVRLLLWGSGLTALIVAIAAAGFAVKRGLRPVARLSNRVDAIDARRLSARLPIDELPDELRPTVVKLNELLGRLEASFERERRFGADASHELRTPLAGIRSALEVALSRPRTAATYRAILTDALASANQMTALVESLLALSRLDQDDDAPATELVPLAALVDECQSRSRHIFRERDVSFENRVDADIVLATDRERMRMVVQNLLTNAAEYTASPGAVVVRSDPTNGVWLEVSDSGPVIPEDIIDKIFDRFFRADAARSTREHLGVGLALVRALCDTLGLNVAVDNRADGWVVFQIRATPDRQETRALPAVRDRESDGLQPPS
jgi:signal transduction histidine kinase